MGKKRSWNTGINLLGVCSLCSAYCLLGLDLSHNVHPSSYAPWEFYHLSSPIVLLMRGIPYGLFPIPFASWTLKKQCVCFCFLLFWMPTGWWLQLHFCHVILVVLVVKNPLANAGDIRVRGSTPESGRSSGVGNGNLLQYSCLKNSMDRGAWRATVHGFTKSWTRLSDWARVTGVGGQVTGSFQFNSVLIPGTQSAPPSRPHLILKFYRWKAWGSDRDCYLSKVIQMVIGRTGIQI